MKRILAVVGLPLVAGCAQPAQEQAVSPEEVTEQQDAALHVEITPGLYGVGDETTEYARSRLNADGTYVDLDGDTPVGSGTWTADGATMCFDPEGDGEDQQERCWINESAGEDGSFISARDDGSQSYRVTPLGE